MALFAAARCLDGLSPAPQTPEYAQRWNADLWTQLAPRLTLPYLSAMTREDAVAEANRRNAVEPDVTWIAAQRKSDWVLVRVGVAPPQRRWARKRSHRQWHLETMLRTTHRESVLAGSPAELPRGPAAG